MMYAIHQDYLTDFHEASSLDNEVRCYGRGRTPQEALIMLRIAIRLRRQVIAIETGRATRQQILDNPSFGSIREEEMQPIA